MKRSPTRSSLSAVLTTRRGPDEVKRDGWRQAGMLAVSIDDLRLSDWERQFIVNLGTRLYGTRREDART
jgi:hypothetical protein